MPIRLSLLMLHLAFGLAGASHAADAANAAEWTDPRNGLSFVWVQPGCFDMGALRAAEAAPHGKPRSPRQDETPQHRVCVDGYWMGRHEVRRDQWQNIMGGRPAAATPADDRRPATHVTWQQAQDFLDRINRDAPPGKRFRLPTEAEWEYACQPGEAQSDIENNRWEREAELKKSAWFRGNKQGATDAAETGTLAPNPRGLFDMLGNVWEWTADTYRADAYGRHAANNPLVSESGDRKVLRGGSFRSDIHQSRCGARAFGLADDPLPTVGLRLVVDSGKKP